MEFIAFTAEAPQQAALSELTTVGSANPESNPKLDAIQQQFNAFSADHSHTIVYSNPKWWAKNLDQATASYTTWKVG